MKPLQRYIVKGGRPLRMGYTTGSCAAGGGGGAAGVSLGGDRVQAVTLDMPGGIPLTVEIEDYRVDEGGVTCTVVKDGGDDPDVTDRAEIRCTVSKIPDGTEIDGGFGVGRVTRPGLPCPVGQAAINPVPRQMIGDALARTAATAGYGGGLRAVVSVPQGELLAKRTFNPRLGIVGGISILGTTGFVEPMSETALTASIHAELDSLAAAGARSLLVVPGNYGADFARRQWGLELDRGVKCSNFVGDTLDYAVYRGFRRIVLLGHAGKLIKLAAGIMNTHSSVADGRAEILAAHCGLAGLDSRQIARIMDCVTIDAADELLVAWGVAGAVWTSIGGRVLVHLSHRVGAGADIGFAAFGARGVLMASKNLERLIEEGLR